MEDNLAFLREKKITSFELNMEDNLNYFRIDEEINFV
jgi:hypothetical protein